MEQIGLQIIVAFFSLFALSRAYFRFKERKLSSFAFTFWFAIWIMGTISILYPSITTTFARLIGIGRGVDVIIYASIIVIFYMIFRIYIKIEDTQRQITEISRKIALKKINKKTSANSSR